MWATLWQLAAAMFADQPWAPYVLGPGVLLYRKKKEETKPAGAEAFELPTSMEGRPYPVVFGCRRVDSPNAVTPLLEFRTKDKEKRTSNITNSKVTVAHYYYVTFQMGVCQANIDGIKQIWVADTCVWPTAEDPDTQAADGQTSITIAAAEVFGGYRREGGVSGTVHIQYGGDAQTLDTYLEALQGSDTPPSRGFTGVILCKTYVGTVPSLKPWSFLCKRTDQLSDGSAMWYIAKAAVGTGGDLNAIHVLYELLTSERIGLGKAAALIGDTFTTAADTCYTEGMGLSCVWDWRPDDIESMVEQIEAIIDGKLIVDEQTGKFEVVLHRDDYEVEDLEAFDESDFWVESMACSSLGSVPSRTVVYWHDRITQKTRPARACDLSLLYKQGACPVTQELDYSAFVCDEDLANTIAARQQQQMSATPKLLVLRALRTMAHLREGGVIKISYPELNITSMVVRVVSISRGSIANGECVVNCMEDVFGQAYTTYATPPAAGTGGAAEDLEEIIIDDNYSEIEFVTDSDEALPTPSASISATPSSSASASPSASSSA